MQKKWLVVLALTIVLSLGVTLVALGYDAQFQSSTANTQIQEPAQKDVDGGLTLDQAFATAIVSEPKGATGEAIYMIRLADAPLASYRGSIEGLEATSPVVRGVQKLDVDSPAAVAYLDYLQAEQSRFIERAETVVKHELDVVYHYYTGNNGVAVRLTPEEAAQLAALPEVLFIQRDFERQLQTDAGPEWIGAPSIWDGTNTSGEPGTMGEGIVVGIIDTGINPLNPSFAEVGPIDGYVHTNPKGQYFGVCDSTDPSYDASFPCNDKLIGAWGYDVGDNGTDPTDYDGHGSHTASTAAGNIVTATVEGYTNIVITRTIMGVAPHANIIAYSACCTLSALTAAIDQAIADEVHVINYSIGSASASDLWNDFDTVGYLNAREGGIFVATSAGNAGPGAETVGSPADAPWITSVGATTHNRMVANYLTDLSGDGTPPATIQGKGFSAGYGPAEIVYAGDYPNPNDTVNPPEFCVEPYPAGTFNGEIVICDRGLAGRVAMGDNVLAGGAGGYILANNEPNGISLNADNHVLPAVHITFLDGVLLKDWVAGGGSHMGTISGTVMDEDPAYADIMAGFSSRGANRALPDIVVPSLVAPGVDILAAYGTHGDIEWNFISGTSMASPHVAGAAALLMNVHPEWTAAEIQSAMMTTAHTGVLDSDAQSPATPFAMGSGRLDLTVAAEAGFVLPEDINNYWDADPSIGGDPTFLNLASFGNGFCLSTCSWSRTISSTQAITTSWTSWTTSTNNITINVTPATFELGPYDTQEIQVEVDVAGFPFDIWQFGEVWLYEDGGNAPDAHFPVVVMPVSGVIPDMVEIETRRDAGSRLIEDLVAVEITDLAVEGYGLTPANIEDLSLSVDPTPGTVYDDLDGPGIYHTLISVPVDAVRLVAEITASEAPDVDLYIGMDTNGNGLPDADEELYMSASAVATEYISVMQPAIGNYWILVQNWAGSDDQPDAIQLAWASVNADDEGLWVEGPSSVPAETPFDLRVFWDEEEMWPGPWYGAFSIGTSPAAPEDIGWVPVDLYRHEDDVTKEASTAYAAPGTTVNYTVTVQPNVTDDDLTYLITDTLPAGVTYVDGSASASAGTVSVNNGVLTWTGVMPSPGFTYDVTSSNETDSCAMALASADGVADGYLNLEAFGILAQAGVQGNNVIYTTTYPGNPLPFFNTSSTQIAFNDDGVLTLDVAAITTDTGVVTIPNPALPNMMMALVSNDMEIIYDAGNNYGVSIANLTSGGVPSARLIEFDDLQKAGEPGSTLDAEMLIRETVSDGTYEIIFAYNNINGDFSEATIGLENPAGTIGVTYDGALSNGMAVCFDMVPQQLDPVTITYSAMVDAEVESGTVVTNTVYHATEAIGSQVDMTEASFMVNVYGVELSDDMADSDFAGSTVEYTVWITNTGDLTDTFDLGVTGETWTTDLSTDSITLGGMESGSFTVMVDIPAGASGGAMDTATVTATSVTDAAATDSTTLTTTVEVEVYMIYLPVILTTE